MSETTNYQYLYHGRGLCCHTNDCLRKRYFYLGCNEISQGYEMYIWEGQNSWVRQGHNGKIGRKKNNSFILKFSKDICNIYEEIHCPFDIA